jgi:hypothetical protein
MRALFHPEFPRDIRRYADTYNEISPGLAIRFRNEIENAVEAIKLAPTAAGHYLNLVPRLCPSYAAEIFRLFPSLFSTAFAGNNRSLAQSLPVVLIR